DIVDKKFIKTEHVGFGLEAVGHDLQRIAFALQRRQLFMNTQHKTVEVQTLFSRSRQALVEHIHHPRFASTNAAPHTKATYRSVSQWLFFSEQSTENRLQAAALRFFRRFCRERLINRIQAVNRVTLNVIWLV